jgi:hypothetical protein
VWWGGGVALLALSTARAQNLAPQGETVAVRGSIPMTIQEIDITYPQGKSPYVSFKKSIPRDIPSFRPAESRFEVLSEAKELLSFGSTHQAEWKEGRLILQSRAQTEGRYGQELFFHRPDLAVDALSYDTLHIRGETSGALALALTDVATRRREDNVSILRVNGTFDIRFPLKTVTQQLDLYKLMSLVLLPQDSINTVSLSHLTFERTERSRQHPVSVGFWLWDYREGVKRGQTVIEACQRAGCRRLFVQMPEAKDDQHLWKEYGQFLRTVKSSGIEAFALDGYPEAINDPTPLIKKLQQLLAFVDNASMDGVQFDIEPYLLEDFFADESGFVRYLATIDQLKAALRPGLRLSIVIPFWFSSQKVNERAVAFAVMDRADEVTIMSYRTDSSELPRLAEDTLRYGDLIGRPVWLALETRPLPLEHHVVLRRETRRERANAYLDRNARQLILSPPPETITDDWFLIHHRFTVPPERVTFAGQSRQTVRSAVTATSKLLPNPSLAGVVIHDLPGFLALTD